MQICTLCSAFSTLCNLYMTQPILPALSNSLACHLCLVCHYQLQHDVSDGDVTNSFSARSMGPKTIMTFSMLRSAILSLAIGFAHNLSRYLSYASFSVVLCRLPRLRCYLAEKWTMELGAAMGLYISGNSIVA